ncbi:MAG: molybdenum cofactor guanylyltransferase [Xanthomonadales bacterium]|nr:molybdenum cofactor guanylyltransferase [Xanthomonadales bacterium]
MLAPQSTIGAILAGGAGQRLGGLDKGLQALAGRPLVEHVVLALRDQVDALLIVANRHHEVYARYASVIADIQAGYAGPLAGIAAALTYADSRCLLSVPVDCPQPPTQLHARLRKALDAQPDASCAVAFDGQRRQPLFALYRPELAQSALQALRENYPVWRWQQSLHALEVDFADQAEPFYNLNTAEDFIAYQRRHDLA